MDKNNQNPFENIEQRINNHFKKNKKIPKTSEPVNFKKHIKKIITFTIIFAVFVILIANVYVVKENEYRVVRQFGEVVEIRFEPGIYMKVPFLQNVTSLPRYQMTYNVSEAEINTKDKKRIIIDNYAVWRITNPKEMITNAGTLLNAEARMEEFIYSVVRTELGQLAYDEIINDENTSRGSLNDRVTERVNELLKSDNYGVEVIDVRMKRTDLPPENEQSVYTRMISERESIAQKYLSEGDADKRTIEAATDRKVQEMVAIAKKEASIITAEAESEAAKIYNESFSKDPEFYALYRTLESYKKTIGKDTMIILPSDSPYAKILTGYLE
ncbi:MULTISPECIES: protease modulator HflC [Paenisporosarcina]|uniref:Protein HflC n=1 Tax=Paenisporosarcina antarctica TaxID=417367 RepID=A0A4P6ZWA9_9BACL|nr:MULTISPECIES: protease modulator HflC [Paenisporosarcina]QBP40681.1 protease modulator HflC [Paenisporosarcina antarctica]